MAKQDQINKTGIVIVTGATVKVMSQQIVMIM